MLRRLVVLAIALALVLAPLPSFAAGSALSVSTALSKPGYTVYKLDWTSDDATGAVNIGFLMRSGRLVQVKYVPDGGGTAPTNLYDVTITDADGADILQGDGADKSATVADFTTFLTTAIRTDGGSYTLNVAAAGNAKGGLIYLYVE